MALGRRVANKSNDTFRTTPNFDILGLTAASGLVNSIHLEDSVGIDLPTVRIVLNNYRNRLGSTILAKEQSFFQVSLGYDNPGRANHGTFIVQKPKFMYVAGQGPSTVEIVGYGEAVKLGATERREVYRKMTDSDITRVIAGRNGFAADVEATSPIYDQVIQANESDWKFLSRRALLYGYMLYVDNGTLHFHKVKPRESGISVTGGDTPGVLQSFIVQSRTFLRGLQLTMTQIDPVTKEEISVQSTETPDAVQSRLEYKNWKDLVSIQGIGQPKRFIVGEGHNQTAPVLSKMVTEMAKASRYVIAGSGLLHGIETLRANDFIEVYGVGRSSGKYYVTSAMHQIDAGEGGAYKVRFEVVRVGAGELSAAGQTTVQPQSAGTVAL
jgi:phage protein D